MLNLQRQKAFKPKMTKEELLQAAKRMPAYNELSEEAEQMLRLLIDGADTRQGVATASLGEWARQMEIALISTWRLAFESATELKTAGFLRGFYGKNRRGQIIATLDDALYQS